MVRHDGLHNWWELHPLVDWQQGDIARSTGHGLGIERLTPGSYPWQKGEREVTPPRSHPSLSVLHVKWEPEHNKNSTRVRCVVWLKLAGRADYKRRTSTG